MDSRAAQAGVLAAGGVLVGMPIYRSVRDTGSMPTMRAVTAPLVVVGACALLASLAPIYGVALAWMIALGYALNESSKSATMQRRKNRPGGNVPRAPKPTPPFGGGTGGAW